MELNNLSKPRLNPNHRIRKETHNFIVDTLRKVFYDLEAPEKAPFNLSQLVPQPFDDTPESMSVGDFVPLSAAAAQMTTSAVNQQHNYYYERFLRDIEAEAIEAKRLQKMMRNRPRNLITGY